MKDQQKEFSFSSASVLSAERRQFTGKEILPGRRYLLLYVPDGGLEVSYGAVPTFRPSPLAAFCTPEDISFSAGAPCEYLMLSLSPEYVLSLTGREKLLTCCLSAFPTGAVREIHACMQELENFFTNGSRNAELISSASVLRILAQLSLLCPEEEVFPPPLLPLTARRNVLYRSILSYIREHAFEEVSQSEAARHFQITPQYLGGFLKKTSGMTYKEAVKAAKERRKSILAPYMSSGGSKNGAPGRKLSAPEPSEKDEETRQIRLYSRIDPQHAMPQAFRSLINLGYASNLRSLDISSALSFVQSEIAFQAGRICRITDLITTVRIQGNSYYNFSAVFSLLDALISHGITPFLELGNKSFMIQETTVLSYTPVSPTDSREYYQELLRILPDFARACINHFGQSSFDSWYFEISFMYTSDEEREKFGLIQYAGIFRKIYSVLRSFSASCRIGGPGFNDWSDTEKIRHMVRLMSSHGIVPDFFSAYLYPLESRREGMTLSGNPMESADRLRLFAEAVREEHPEKEIWITEFNSNLSSRNYLNDTTYQAAFIAKTMTEALPLKVDGIGYYLLSDAPLRYLDSLDFLFGGWGLLNDRGLPKPSFYAYCMMKHLGHYLIRSGSNYLITANSRGSFQILLFRYQHPAAGYLFRNIEKEDLLLPDAVFENAGTDDYRITVSGVLKGTYYVKEYRIDETHSNLFQVWKSLDFLYPPNASLLKELQMKSSLLPEIHIRRLKEGDPFVFDLSLRGTQLTLITVDLYASHIIDS